MPDRAARSSWSPTAGPVTFQDDGTVKRGTGGLVTALTGLASHRDAVWIASALTDGDARKAARGRGQGRSAVALARRRRVPGAARRVRPRGLRPLLQHLREPDAVVHPALPLGPVERPGHPPQRGRGVRVRLQRRQRGPRARRDRGDRGRRRAGRDGPRLPPLHAAGARAPRAPRRLPAPLRPHPVDAARRLARAAAADPRGDLLRPARQRHHRLPHAGLPAQLPAVLPRPDGPRRRLRARRRAVRGREVWVRAYPLPIDAEATLRGRGVGAAWREFEARAAAPPARPPDPARRPRRPVEERPARLHRRSTCSSSSTPSSASA